MRPIVCALLLRIRQMAAAVLTDGDRAAELGEGALRAGRSVADFAPRADRHDGRGVVRLDSVGVDHAIGVGDVAPETDGEVLFGGDRYPRPPLWVVRAIHR